MNSAAILLSLAIGLPAVLEATVGGPAFGVRALRDSYGDPLPDGAVARLGSARWRVAGSGITQALLFGRDSRSCYTFGNANNFFEYPGGRPRPAPFLGNANAGVEAVFSPNDRYVYAGVRQGIYRLDRARGQWQLGLESSRFNGTSGFTQLEYAFAADGRTALVAAFNAQHRNRPYGIYRVRLGWPLELREVERQNTSTADLIEIALSADGRYAAVVEASLGSGGIVRHRVRYRDFESGRTAVQIPAANGFVNGVKFAPGADGLLVRTMEELLLLENPLAAAGRGTILARRAIPPITGNSTPNGLMALSGDRLLYAGNSGQLILADRRTLKAIWTRPTGDSYFCAVQCAAFTADGRAIGFVNTSLNIPGTLVRFLDAATGRETTPVGHNYPASKAAFHPNRPLLATASDGNEVRLWAWETRRGSTAFLAAGSAQLAQFADASLVKIDDLQFVEGGRRLYVPGPAGHRFECDFAGGFRFRNERPFDRNWGDQLKYSPDGRRSVNWDVQTSTIFACETGKNPMAVRLEIDPGRIAYANSAFGGDGRVVAFAALPAGVAYLDTATGKCIAADRRPGDNFRGRSRFLAGEDSPAPDGSTAYRLIDLRTGRRWCRAVVGAAAHAFSADGHYAAVADPDTNARIQLVELLTGRPVRNFNLNFTGNPPSVVPVCLDFSPDGKLLASALSDGTVLIWDCDPSSAGIRPFGPGNAGEMAESLRGANAKRGNAAIGWAVSHPAEALAHFRAAFAPDPQPDRADAERLLRRLADPRYAARSAAARDLARIEPLLPGWLDGVRGRKLDAEVAGALERLANRPILPRDGRAEISAARAVECLERIGSPEAKAYLKEMYQRGGWAALMAGLARERAGE